MQLNMCLHKNNCWKIKSNVWLFLICVSHICSSLLYLPCFLSLTNETYSSRAMWPPNRDYAGGENDMFIIIMTITACLIIMQGNISVFYGIVQSGRWDLRISVSVFFSFFLSLFWTFKYLMKMMSHYWKLHCSWWQQMQMVAFEIGFRFYINMLFWPLWYYSATKAF